MSGNIFCGHCGSRLSLTTNGKYYPCAEDPKATDELNILKSEVVKAIQGESSFSTEMLSNLISEAGARCAELQDQYEAAQAAYEEGKEVLEDLKNQFNQIVSWSEMYDSASKETKKIIASHLIKRVDVYRNYKLHINRKRKLVLLRERVFRYTLLSYGGDS